MDVVPMRKLLAIRELSVLVILVTEVVVITAVVGTDEVPTSRGGGALETTRRSPFLNADNLYNQGRHMAPIGIAAVGAAMVIISGGIDLSCGSVLGLASVVAAWLAADHHWPMVAACLAGIAAGGLCGFVNGALVGWARIPPFIATLGMLSVARGVAFAITGGSRIRLPDSFSRLDEADPLLGLPIPFLVMIVVALAGWAYLRYMRTGRYVFALGGNENAARFSGINVARVKVGIYTLAGLASGLAGIVWASITGSTGSTTGRGYELQIIAAVVVGGASLAGGRGSPWGALMGTAILTFLGNAVTMSNIPEEQVEIAVGTVIVVAGLVDSLGQTGFWARLGRWWLPPPRAPVASSHKES